MLLCAFSSFFYTCCVVDGISINHLRSSSCIFGVECTVQIVSLFSIFVGSHDIKYNQQKQFINNHLMCTEVATLYVVGPNCRREADSVQ